MAKSKLDRTEHTNVIAGGKPFRSVKAAFEALKLPINKHQKFRRELRQSATGSAVFKHERRAVTFKIAPAAAE